MRRGWKTTEFWVTALVIAGVVLTQISSANVLPEKYATLAAGLAAAGYGISRGLAKLNKPE